MRFDVRFILPIAGLLAVLLVIVWVQLFGSDDTGDIDESLLVALASPTVVPTFTPGPSPTRGPETATPSPVLPPGAPETAEARDLLRVGDLLKLETALADFHAANGSYPTSNGQTQSLCVYLEIDVGCALEEFIQPLPATDPLGNAAGNGYFYISDGTTFGVYAMRESESIPPCPLRPEHLGQFDTVICIEGPSAEGP